MDERGLAVLIDDGWAGIAAELPGLADPLPPLAATVPLDDATPARLAAVFRLWRTLRGHIPRHPATRIRLDQRQRLVLSLRALDGKLAGANTRAVAVALFGRGRVPDDRAWKTHDLKGRTIRLAAGGAALVRGGYRKLLRRYRPRA